MAAADLRQTTVIASDASRAIRSPADPHRERRGLTACMLLTLAAVWLLTAAAALITATVPAAGRLARHTLDLPLRPASTPTPWRMVDIALTNALVISVPLLLRLLVGERPGRAARRRSAGLLVVWLAGNVIPVGAAIGAYGTPIVSYLPQLPLEWAALAMALAGYRHARPSERRGAVLALGAAVIAVTLTAAAALETYATPHA